MSNSIAKIFMEKSKFSPPPIPGTANEKRLLNMLTASDSASMVIIDLTRIAAAALWLFILGILLWGGFDFPTYANLIVIPTLILGFIGVFASIKGISMPTWACVTGSYFFLGIVFLLIIF